MEKHTYEVLSEMLMESINRITSNLKHLQHQASLPLQWRVIGDEMSDALLEENIKTLVITQTELLQVSVDLQKENIWQ